MPRVFAVVQSFLRVMLALALWVGVSAAASSAEPTSEVFSGRSDLHFRLIELLGGPELCGDDADEEDDILCGGDLLADLVADPAVLRLSRSSCSRLLEALFTQSLCDPRDEACGKLQQGQAPPALPPEALGPTGPATLATGSLRFEPQPWILAALRARDDPPLVSRCEGPGEPPPRGRLA